MLDRQKLIMQFDQLDQQLFSNQDQQRALLKSAWNLVKGDLMLSSMVQIKKWSILVPAWQGVLGQAYQIQVQPHPYQVLAVDGSQIYYDRHQGPACFLINIGSVFFSYELTMSSVKFESAPSIAMVAENNDGCSPEVVNLKREHAELARAAQLSSQAEKSKEGPFLCLFDGTLIFFQTDGQTEQKEHYLAQYLESLQIFYDQKLLHAGYVSFPKSKELINVLKLVIAGFDEKKIEVSQLRALTDMDVVQMFLKPQERSIVFASKLPVSYLYPPHLKPYFCYINVDFEIARLEFPAWIAQNEQLVNQICAIVLDQAQKGKGYPVCLFEAHEQAVVKSSDRDFFYHMIQKMMQKQSGLYQVSKKSLKKILVPV